MTHFYVLYALSAVSIGLGIALFLKIKTAIYLLEQPVVKKMSPQLNLKPIKVDQIEGASDRNASRNGTPMNRSAGRPEGDRAPREDRGGRDGRDRGERAPRGEREGEGRREGGDRGPRSEGDRGPRSEGPRGEGRGDRGDRFGGREGGRDRDRGGRDGHRHDRGDRGPRREFSNTEREPAQAEARAAAPAGEAPSSSPAPLAPRRPLPSTVDHEETKPAAVADEAGAADPFFGRDDSDIQHGRRNQLKKKPKFDEAEVEPSSTEETKVL